MEANIVGSEQDEVVIYWRPDCMYCLKLLLRLRGTRLRYRKADIRRDPGAKAFVRSVADGNETVPTVVASRALVNPYVEAGRKVRRNRGKATARGVRSNEVRDWAKTNGVEIKERGRVPAEVVTKFLTATGQ